MNQSQAPVTAVRGAGALPAPRFPHVRPIRSGRRRRPPRGLTLAPLLAAPSLRSVLLRSAPPRPATKWRRRRRFAEPHQELQHGVRLPDCLLSSRGSQAGGGGSSSGSRPALAALTVGLAELGRSHRGEGAPTAAPSSDPALILDLTRRAERSAVGVLHLLATF